MVKKACDCNRWLENIPKIDSAIVMANIHGMDCNVDIGKYCMYCGRELEVVE